jgi:putative DNA primase/helicase
MGEDATKIFLDDCCTLDAQEWTASSVLFLKWEQWAEAHGEYVGSAKRLGQSLEKRGLRPTKKGGERGYQGVGIAKAAAAPPPETVGRDRWEKPF